MSKLLNSLLENAKKLLYASPMLIALPLLFYTLADDASKKTVDSFILQTPAKGLIANNYDYYPRYLDNNDIVVYQKTYTDENGNEFTGAVIEVHRPVAFASPADTGSMQPMFGAGNLLVQEKVDSSTALNQGDIIVYSYDGKLIIHQIVGQLDNCYVTKGMNNPVPDSVCVTKDMIKYRLLFAIPTN